MNKNTTQSITYPKGFVASGVSAGIKRSGKPDFAIIQSTVPAAVAGTFTQNKVAAAPVIVSRETVRRKRAQAIVVNSGVANACTGEQGLADARRTMVLAGQALGIEAEDIVVASTGVIGQPLPMDKMEKGIVLASCSLSDDASELAARAILTTDTKMKAGVRTIIVGGKEVRLGAIAKGSGMIRPNMATMLCFVTTDVAIEADLLQAALRHVVGHSFNMISVDGDMSTNDMCIVLANGAADNKSIVEQDEDYWVFVAALQSLCIDMARAIAADGEGATKLINIHVNGAVDFEDAKKAGMSIANSPLVKTAFFGEDPNWGRIVCAAGYSGAEMDPNKTRLSIGDEVIFDKGVGTSYDTEKVAGYMAATEIDIFISLGEGEGKATVWTCDFSYDYVKINGEYHT